MSFSNSIFRIIDYFRRHGLRATLDRAELAMHRVSSAGRMVVFYYDCSSRGAKACTEAWPESLKVERIESQAELDAKDAARIINFWNPRIAQESMTERFGAGATLWLIRYEGQLAGYGWTLTGGTMRPYFIPLAPEDVHLFDYLVFPEFRGRGVNSCLVRFILDRLTAERRGRAYIEVAEWNKAELRSLKRTPFRRLGVARKMTMLGPRTVEWRGRGRRNGQ